VGQSDGPGGDADNGDGDGSDVLHASMVGSMGEDPTRRM
jgi:hypothetical protein